MTREPDRIIYSTVNADIIWVGQKLSSKLRTQFTIVYDRWVVGALGYAFKTALVALFTFVL